MHLHVVANPTLSFEGFSPGTDPKRQAAPQRRAPILRTSTSTRSSTMLTLSTFWEEKSVQNICSWERTFLMLGDWMAVEKVEA